MSKTLRRTLILFVTAGVSLGAAATFQGPSWPPPRTAGPVIPLWPEGVPRQIANGGPDLLERYSLDTRVTPDTPPAFLVHGGTDTVVVPENSVLFYSALRRPDWLNGRGLLTPAPQPRVLPPAPAGVVIEKDVAYLETRRAERLDLYRPETRARDVRSPAVVIIHGGGWTGGDKGGSREFNIGTTLAKAGYVAASINYWLGEARRWPTNLMDCKNAVRFLRANAARYGIDADRIGVIGGSAGGHLALMVAYTAGDSALEPAAPYPGVSSGVRAVVDMYGPTNLLTRQTTDKEGNPTGRVRLDSHLLASRAEDDADAWKAASPVSRVRRDVPPTLILHGTADTTVDRDQSKELAAALARVGAVHELRLIPGVGHTFDLQTWERKPMPVDLGPVVVAFLDRHVRR